MALRFLADHCISNLIIALQMRNHPEILPYLLARLTGYLEIHSEMKHFQGKLFVVEVDRIRIRE